MINATHTGLQRAGCLPYLAAPANCSVNRAPTECRRALFTWPGAGEEEGHFSIALHGFLMITVNSLFASPGLSLPTVEFGCLLVAIAIGSCITAEF